MARHTRTRDRASTTRCSGFWPRESSVLASGPSVGLGPANIQLGRYLGRDSWAGPLCPRGTAGLAVKCSQIPRWSPSWKAVQGRGRIAFLTTSSPPWQNLPSTAGERPSCYEDPIPNGRRLRHNPTLPPWQISIHCTEYGLWSSCRNHEKPAGLVRNGVFLVVQPRPLSAS